MPKWKSSYDSTRKFKPVWEKEFPWIKKHDKTEEAYCKLCRKSIAPRKAAIIQHSKTKEHSLKANAESNTVKLDNVFIPKVSDTTRTAELELATAVCCHSSLLCVDHLGEIIKRNGKGSTVSAINLHRTKFSRLVDAVIAPSMKADLKKDVQGKKYSILLDESTDVSTAKHLIPVVRTTGESLFSALKSCLEEFDLPLSDCIGLGSDGAANMVGARNSVWSRVKLESPNCVLFKCICHSLALCVEKAFEVLPSSVGFLLAEIPAWFSRSCLRREDCKTLIENMSIEDADDANEQNTSCQLPFMTLCPTRWLVRGEVLHRLLGNWSDLKAHFSSAAFDQSSRYKARTISDM